MSSHVSDFSQVTLDFSPEFSADIRQRYTELCAKNLSLDMTRGKPSVKQLDLSDALLDLPGSQKPARTCDGVDVRNYGGWNGIKDIRVIFAEILGVRPDQIIAGDASSLNIEFDILSWAMHHGLPDSEVLWSGAEKRAWLCPVPGYDRHFLITEFFGFTLIPVPMREDGPDVDRVRELVKDPSVKGMWCVPTYSNPTGAIYSQEVCEQLASMDTAAPDFTIMWDNAYAVHSLEGEAPKPIDVLSLAAEAGHPNRFFVFASTSKITHAGSGVAFMASSEQNLAWYARTANVRGIGPNKVNQLAHARFFGDAAGVRAHMRRHAESLAPKFRAVQTILEERLGGTGIASWTTPTGGYFISLDVFPGTATRVVELAAHAGITLTAAGSTFPYGRDPEDKNVRLAPSMPSLEEIQEAMDGVATCVLLAAVEKHEASI